MSNLNPGEHVLPQNDPERQHVADELEAALPKGADAASIDPATALAALELLIRHGPKILRWIRG